ncbi:hypothetical protein CBR_g66671 [Chara braunii]|uniref:Uncharacterized protein n=1 Tax=Chara braunii TaxID=69332 RepID=A0A388JPY5_CHABU|nr:hypothetical protein CBR_g66671 [Chara braunii]|eukprot:GBG59864.1 hypothetical protein CBR_g66671 [Chara braunii]
MVDLRSGKSTMPYSKAQEEQTAAILRERKEKELIQQAKMKMIPDEQAVKKKKLEEEMKRLQQEEEERLKAAIEEEIEEEEEPEEESLRRRGMGGRGESNRMKEDDPWVEKSDPIERQAIENEKRLDWKLRLAREKKRRTEEANWVAREVESLQTCRQEVEAQPDIQAKLDKIIGSIELLGRAWTEHHQSVRGQDMALHSIRSGFREFARGVMTYVGNEVRKLKEGARKFCTGAIEDTKEAVAAEMEVRTREEPVKLKFHDSYGGKEEENFDNWEASINTYVHLQHIVPEEQVLVAFHALKDEAASFARSLA